MKSAGVLLAMEQRSWRLARCVADEDVQVREIPRDGDADPLAALDDVAAAISEWDACGSGVCLGLPSRAVFSARIDSGDLPRRDRRSAMLYRLEEQLPLEAESLTVDFLPATGGLVLGLTVRTAEVRAIVDRLEELGVEVAAICPTSLLTLWQALHESGKPADYALIHTSEGVDVFRLAERTVAGWSVVGPDAEELAQCLQADLLAAPREVMAPTALFIADAPCPTSDLRGLCGMEVTRPTVESPMVLAARAAGRLLAGRPAGWIDLRRDGLAPSDPWGRVAGLARSAAVLGLVSLIAAAATFFYRGMQYDAAAGQFERQQVTEFQRVFANRPEPPNVKSRLRSELALLSGVSGSGFDLPPQPSALQTLRRIVANLPPAIRLRVTQMQVGPTGILLDGQARAHSDAELIARTLKQGGLAIDPPTTERLVRGGVSFTLVGRVDPSWKATAAPALAAKEAKP